MRIYILVEGRRTEAKVYPAWLSHTIPGLQRIHSYNDNANNSYYLLSAEGYPSIYEYLVDAIADVNAVGNYDYLMACLDADEASTDEKRDEVQQFLDERGARLMTARPIVIVQNRCIETWFLGNRRIIRRNPQSALLRSYLLHYNVVTHDPELMVAPPTFNTHSQFHGAYLKEVFRERGISYSKTRPGDVLKRPYLEELKRRVADEPTHLASLRLLLEFFAEVNTELESG